MHSIARSRSFPSARFALAAMLAFVASCDSPSGPTPAGPPAHLDIVSGDAQTAVVGTALAAPLVVHVTDDKGKDVQGQVVNFRVTAGNGTVFAGAASTDKDGRAQERWTLGTVARDTQKVEVRAVDASTGNPIVFATFRAVATPDVPAALTRVSGDAQAAPLGSALADSLAVKLADRYGNGVGGQTVAFAVASGGGSVGPASIATDSSGIAKARWTLGARLDTAQAATATFGSLPPVGFAATATVAGTLTKGPGDAQTGTVGHFLADSLAVQLKLADGTPVRGATVQWTTATGSLLPATGKTDASGTVKVAWLLGTASGPQTATAAVVGGTQTVGFAATATADAAVKLEKVSGDGQSGPAGTALADSLAVRALDTYGNVVSGVALAWSAPSGSGSLSPAASSTGANGVGKARWTLGGRVDSAQVATVTSGALAPVSFSASASVAGVLSVVSGDGQSAMVLKPLPDSFVVQLATSGGVPVAGVTVTFTDSYAVTATAVTDAAGRARVRWTVTNAVGTQHVWASVPRVNTVFFTYQALSGPVQNLRLVSGNAQTGPVNTALADSLRVIATDQYTHPVAGALVRFEPLESAGSFSPDTVRTRADGTAAAQWKLGSNGGEQSAVVSVVGAASTVSFYANAVGSMSLQVWSPIPGPILTNTVFGDVLPVAVDVHSQFAVASVVASVLDRQTTLTCLYGVSCSGSISLVGLPRDTLKVTFTAVDKGGVSATVSGLFIHDKVPAVTLQSLPAGRIQTGVLHAVATCQDDDPAGCTRLEIRIGSTSSPAVATGTADIDAMIPVSKYQGQTISVYATGTDSRGQSTSTSVSVLVDSTTVVGSAHLQQDVSVPGQVLDVSTAKVLYRDTVSGAVRLRDRGDGTEATIVTSSTAAVQGYITSLGAVLNRPLSGGLLYWRDGTATNLGGGDPFSINGDWVAWVSGGSSIVRRNLVTAAMDTVKPITAEAPRGVDVAPNGDWAFWNYYSVQAFRGGVLRDYIGFDTRSQPVGAIIDNAHVVFSVNAMRSQPYELSQVVAPQSAKTPVAAPTELWRLPYARRDYFVNGGWTAYFRVSPSGPYAVWRLSPSGVAEQVAGMAQVGLLEGVGDEGTVVYSVPEGSFMHRYLSSPGSAALDLGTAIDGDRVLWRSGAFVVLRGGVAYRIVP